MAKDRRKLQHIHSSIQDRQPTPQTLEVGEIAVNNYVDKEFISLKNTNNKVVRFSSDKQMITWMEKKEVMPYSGTVDNVHLDTNRSNIEIKLNQVVAKNTAKYDVVNGAKDIDGNDVNPSSDGGLTNGAGFAIDMSRYAMIGANPSFSSITVTHQSNLNGATNISNGAGGSKLTITTTDVNSTNTNWTETIANKNETITSEVANISGRTTTIGNNNEVLHVIGTTTETHDKHVTINNKANVNETTDGTLTELIKTNNYRDVDQAYSGRTGSTTTEYKVGDVEEYHSGTTVETKKGDVTETNLSAKTETTTGVYTQNNKSNYSVNTTGNTTFTTTGNTTISGSSLASTTTGNTSIHADGAIGITAVGDIIAVSSESDIYITANDDLSATAGDIAAFKGVNKTNIGIDTEGDEDSVVTNIYGETINIRAKTADITSVSSYTNASTATTVIGTADTQVTSAKTVILTANTNATTATLSGNTLEIKEATSLTYSGGTLSQITTGNTTVSVGGDLSETSTNNTTITTKGADKKLTLKTEGSGSTIVINADGKESDLDIDAKDDITIDAGDSITITAKGKTKIDSTSAVTIQATDATDGDINIYAKDALTESGKTVDIIGTDSTTIKTTGDGSDIFIYAKDKVDISGTSVNITGDTTIDDELTVKSGLTVSTDVSVAGTLTATTISGVTDIMGTTISGGTGKFDSIECSSGLSKKLTFKTGTTSASGSYNGSEDLTITVPSKLSHLTNDVVNNGKFSVSGNGTSVASMTANQSGDSGVNIKPGSFVSISTDTSEITIGVSTGTSSSTIARGDHHHDSRYVNVTGDTMTGSLGIESDLSVSGTITATGAIYSSDINLKENIEAVDYAKIANANGVAIKKFNFKDDDSKRTVYGVIAQEVEAAGVEDIVVTREDGFKGVDYTALSLLKIAYLENKVKELEAMIKQLMDNK